MHLHVGWPFLLEWTPSADMSDAGLFARHIARPSIAKVQVHYNSLWNQKTKVALYR